MAYWGGSGGQLSAHPPQGRDFGLSTGVARVPVNWYKGGGGGPLELYQSGGIPYNSAVSLTYM